MFILLENLFCARSWWNHLQILIHLILLTILPCRCCCYSRWENFRDEKIQGTLARLPRIRIGSKWWGWGLNPGSLTPGFGLLTSSTMVYCTIVQCHTGFEGQKSRLSDFWRHVPNHSTTLSMYRMKAVVSLLFFFLLCPRPGIKPIPQQWPEP